MTAFVASNGLVNNFDAYTGGSVVATLDSTISMCIYTITHRATGRIYVGQTTGKAKVRWRGHCSARSGSGKSAIKSAIQKYGRDAFVFEVIDVSESQDQLNHKERFWIARLNSVAPAGFNLELGGNSTGKVSEATKKLISARVKEAYERDPTLRFRCTMHNVGRIMSDPEKLRRSESVKAAHQADLGLTSRKTDHLKGKSRPDSVKKSIAETLRGKEFSAERRAAISAGMKPLTIEQRIDLARRRYTGKPIKVNGIIFQTAFEAELSTGIPAGQISTAIRRGNQFVKGVKIEVVS